MNARPDPGGLGLKQPAELDQYSNPKLPDPGRLLRILKVLGGFFVMIITIAIEGYLFGAIPLQLLIVQVTVLLALILFIAFLSRSNRPLKRELILTDKSIRIGPASAKPISWSKVFLFHLEPAGPAGEYTKATIQYSGPGPASRPCWSIALADSAQREALIAELNRQKASSAAKFELRISDTPIPPVKRYEPKAWPSLLMALAFLLFANGGMFTIAGLDLPDGHPAQPHRPTQNQRATAYAAFLPRHLATRAEMDHFSLISGLILFAAGIAAFKISSAASAKSAAAYRLEVFGNASLLP